jgi:hypothetical protein
MLSKEDEMLATLDRWMAESGLAGGEVLTCGLPEHEPHSPSLPVPDGQVSGSFRVSFNTRPSQYPHFAFRATFELGAPRISRWWAVTGLPHRRGDLLEVWGKQSADEAFHARVELHLLPLPPGTPNPATQSNAWGECFIHDSDSALPLAPPSPILGSAPRYEANAAQVMSTMGYSAEFGVIDSAQISRYASPTRPKFVREPRPNSRTTDAGIVYLTLEVYPYADKKVAAAAKGLCAGQIRAYFLSTR